MKTLIVINNLLCGGAQKSLVSLLNSLNKDDLDVDLFVLNQKNIFFDQIPQWVNCLPPVDEINAIYLPLKGCLKQNLSAKMLLIFLLAKISLNINRDAGLDSVQNLWRAWRRYIPIRKQHYDLAISYVDGFSNYYVVDKVSADKKILWVHNEYEQLSYCAEFDRNYFRKADSIVTISDVCGDSLKKVFPELSNRIRVIPNLSLAKLIKTQATEFYPAEYESRENIVVSIGRLDRQKAFDLAIEAVSILRNRNVNLSWFILGEGEERESLQKTIDNNGLSDDIKLIGIRKNPYPYIKYADVFVQTSRFEGKSIVLDEAKILAKPIVTTNYPSVIDSIHSGVNGLVVGISSEDIANGIEQLLTDSSLRERVSSNLAEDNRNETDELALYKELLQIK